MSPKQSLIIEEVHSMLSAESKNTITLNDFISKGSYRKGASIIRMLQHLVGNNNFMAALTRYLDTK